ncbi:PREDICTED: protein PPP5D1, partial [Apaloderma vittatum]|uniref:protein PPP5D1 n=1 Tax=Apaloderma vittatum TaxID=57397 RepID=UPI0005218398
MGDPVIFEKLNVGASSVPPPPKKPKKKVVKVRPNDKDAKLKYQECHKIVKQKAFERAIASDEHKRSVVDSLDIESM